MSLVKQRFIYSMVFLSAALCNGQVISEFMASNDSYYPTPAGAYEDWIEIHNNTDTTLNLSGWYLTDDPANLRKWAFPSIDAVKIPPDGYLVVFADDSAVSMVGTEIHASFKLSAGGEYLALVEGDTVVHQYFPEFPDQTTDVSYGLDSVSGEPTYFSVPTPGTANGQGIADVVQFSANSGTFTDAFSLTLSVPSPTASIFYTTDGSLPSTNSTPYTAPITISETTSIRAQTFDPGRTAGPVRTETFILLTADADAFTSDLPLIILDNFGAGEIPASTNLVPNRQLSQFILLEPVNGVCRLSEPPAITSRAGIKRRGESSLRDTLYKPNLSLEIWGENDEESRSIEPLGMPAESDWILHAPWNIDTAMMRNSFMYDVSREAGRYAVRERFVEVFLNYDGGSVSASDYYGLYVLMEKIKIGPDRVDIEELSPNQNTEPDITGGYIWKLDKSEAPGTNDPSNFSAAGKSLAYLYTTTNSEGVISTNLSSGFQFVSPDGTELTTSQTNYLINYINATDVTITNRTYKSRIDVAAFADHHVLNVFAQNADGLRVSTFYFKDRNGLMNMGPIWDFDRSMGCDNDSRPSNPAVWSLATDQNYFFQNSGPLWFTKLSYDPEFWTTWVDRWQAMRDGPLSDTNITTRIEGYRTEIAAAAERNYARWNLSELSQTNWTGKVDHFKTHVLTRALWIDNQLVDPPAFSPADGLVVSGASVTISCGTNKIYYTRNGADPRAVGGSPSGTLYSSPFTITSNTVIKTRGWNSKTFSRAPTTWPWSALREAVFVVNPATLAITELMYHPRSPTNVAELAYATSDFEFIEVLNTNATPCALTGVRLLDGVDFSFTPNTVLGGGQYGVVVANLDAFKLRYTNWPSLNILGVFTGSLNDSGERVRLGYANTNIPGRISFDYEDDWYPCTDGEGFSLVLNNPRSTPVTWDSKTAWRYSSAIDGSPGVANPALTYAPGAIVINEVLSHQDQDNPGDWIELRNTTGSNINIGGWFLSDSRGDLKKYVIPAGTTIPANGYVVFTEYSHFKTNFALSEFGDTVYLSAGSSGNLAVPAYRESASFGAQERNVTFGRYTKSDGTVDFAATTSATQGSTNSAPRVGPVVFDQVMYHPPLGGNEYIRLRNISNETVPLYDQANPSNTWKVAGIDFDFPESTVLAAEETCLLVESTMDPETFREIYAVPSEMKIFSYSGSLDNTGETLVLKKPGTPEANGYVSYIETETLKYKDSDAWPLNADGMGKALGRISLTSYGNDVINWQAVEPDYTPPKYALTVNSGSGDGSYSPGTVVSIAADPPVSGKLFVRWAGNVAGVANASASSTTLTMPAANTTLAAIYSSNSTLVAKGSIWKYNDQGLDLGTAWREPGYNDSTWSNGVAKLGYGDNQTTTIGFGPDPDNKYITYYFRQKFNFSSASAATSLQLNLLRDDGAVVYINGTEVLRDNLPAGDINDLTLASTVVNDPKEDLYYSFSVPASVLASGTNVIAIEVHQQAPDSSDLSFVAQLIAVAEDSVPDADADGLPDAWEIEHFGSTDPCLPLADADGDGFSNFEEYISGNDPANAASYFKISGMNTSGLIWDALTGRVYSVYRTTNLLTQPFVEIASGLTQGSFTNTAQKGAYRVKVQFSAP